MTPRVARTRHCNAGARQHDPQLRQQEYDQFDITIDGKDDAPKKHVEGELHSCDYGTREGVSEIPFIRNLETARRYRWLPHPGYISASKGKTWVIIENSGSYY